MPLASKIIIKHQMSIWRPHNYTRRIQRMPALLTTDRLQWSQYSSQEHGQ